MCGERRRCTRASHRGRPVGDADQQLRKDPGPLMGKSSPTRRSWEMARVSLYKEMPRENTAERACRCWHGGVAPPASQWLAVTQPAVGVDCQSSARSGQRQRALASLFIFMSMLRHSSLPRLDALWICEWRCRMHRQCLPPSARALGVLGTGNPMAAADAQRAGCCQSNPQVTAS